MENRLYRHKWPFLFAPEHSSAQAECPTCTVFTRCDGCPYPGPRLHLLGRRRRLHTVYHRENE